MSEIQPDRSTDRTAGTDVGAMDPGQTEMPSESRDEVARDVLEPDPGEEAGEAGEEAGLAGGSGAGSEITGDQLDDPTETGRS